MPAESQAILQCKNEPETEDVNDLVSIFGVRITNLSRWEAVELLKGLIEEKQPYRAHSVFIVNAHTLNLAMDQGEYHSVLCSAYKVLGDGTGVRWAARLRGVRMKDNLVGTDLIPKLFEATAGRGYRYFLLGADENTVSRAARACSSAFPGWELAGFQHGYLSADDNRAVIEKVNAAQPHLLLVGMGNPKQEQWIHANQGALEVPVCIGVGGLFHHWAGDLKRAPAWVRKQGFEWLQLLLQQPHKWRRYLLGNPLFLMRIARETRSDRRFRRPLR